MFLLSAFVASCTHDGIVSTPRSEKISLIDFDRIIPPNINAKEKEKIIEGVETLKKQDYAKASQLFNAILNDDPTNSFVHTLNALTYQMMGKNGDYGSYDLAEAGYLQAKKFDSNNMFASLQLGRVKAEKKNYVGAQDEFAEVLLFDPKNQEALYELASVSYLMGDVKTASMSVDQLLKENNKSPKYLRAAAMIYAAQGHKDQAKIFLGDYKKFEKSQKDTAYLERRVDDWVRAHETEGVKLVKSSEDSTAAVQGFMDMPSEPGRSPTENIIFPTRHPRPVNPEPKEPMVVIDGVVMRVIEEAQTSKGNNILNNFTLTIAPYTKYAASHAGSAITGASIFPLNNSTASSNNSSIPGSVNSAVQNINNNVLLVTRGISFGTLSYALNIANATRQHIEIIGRPTLTTYVGKPSAFFNGAELDIALTSSFGGGPFKKHLRVAH